MDPITKLNLLNIEPTIYISHQCLEAIKFLVAGAPQETQWFHTIEEKKNLKKPWEINLHLGDELYIPKQNTSMTQVDSSSQHMIDFYNELKNKMSIKEVNNVLQNMNCWCHSHHTMSPSPSGQDVNQFNTFVDDTIDQNLNKIQIMMIWNKTDQFYTRVFLPEHNMIIEGVKIKLKSDYDFNYIEKALSEKLIKPKFKKNRFSKANVSNLGFDYSNQLWGNMDDLQSSVFENDLTLNKNEYNFQISKNIINEIFKKKKTISFTEKNINALIFSLEMNGFLEREWLILFAFIKKDIRLIKYLWKKTDINISERYIKEKTCMFETYLSDKSFDSSYIISSMTYVFDCLEMSSKKGISNILKEVS